MIMRYVAVAARNIACWYAIYDMCCQWLCYLCTSRHVVHDLWGLMPVSVAWMHNVLDYSAICGLGSAWACCLCSISSPWSCDMLHLCFTDVYECRSYDMLLIIKRLRITAVRECHFCQGECTTQPSALKCRLAVANRRCRSGQVIDVYRQYSSPSRVQSLKCREGLESDDFLI